MLVMLAWLRRWLERDWPEGTYRQQIEILKAEHPMVGLPPLKPPKITRRRKPRVVAPLRKRA